MSVDKFDTQALTDPACISLFVVFFSSAGHVILVLKKYFTRSLRSLVKYFQHSKRNFVSPRGHILYLSARFV